MDTLSVSRSPPRFVVRALGSLSGPDPARPTRWHQRHALIVARVEVQEPVRAPWAPRPVRAAAPRLRQRDAPGAAPALAGARGPTPCQTRCLASARLRRGASTQTARWISRSSSRRLHSPQSPTGLRALPHRHPQRAAGAGGRQVKRRRGSERRAFRRPCRQRRSAILAYALNPSQSRMPSEQSLRHAQTTARSPCAKRLPLGRRCRPGRSHPTGADDA
jgi:hypothetical protein